MMQATRMVSMEDVKKAAAGSERIVLWGYIEYRDPLPGGKLHHTRWCNYASPITAGQRFGFSYPLYRPECNTSD
jgi:hypothetical protein